MSDKAIVVYIYESFGFIFVCIIIVTKQKTFKAQVLTYMVLFLNINFAITVLMKDLYKLFINTFADSSLKRDHISSGLHGNDVVVYLNNWSLFSFLRIIMLFKHHNVTIVYLLLLSTYLCITTDY